MDTHRFVRELKVNERPVCAKTGDTLPDGTVLLWERDMERMGLRELRNWLSQTVSQGASGIALAEDARSLRLLDEEYNV